MHSSALKKFNLVHHRHTGKKLPHHHTSYGFLLLIMISTGYLFSTYSPPAGADPASSSGSIGLSGIMPGPPPSTPAVIEKPVEGQNFTNQHIVVSGTCPDSSIVQILRNDIFAGSVNCEAGKFQLSIDLLPGANRLLAKVVDNLGQAGPDSATTNVYYDPPKNIVTPDPNQKTPNTPIRPGTPTKPNIPPLLLTTESYYRGSLVNQKAILDLTVEGGTPAYALEVHWGDGESILIPRSEAGRFSTEHLYKTGGIFNIVINASDSAGSKFYMQVAVLVNGTPPIATGNITDTNSSSPTSLIWPVYLLITGFIGVFWLGERFEFFLLKRSHKLAT